MWLKNFGGGLSKPSAALSLGWLLFLSLPLLLTACATAPFSSHPTPAPVANSAKNSAPNSSSNANVTPAALPASIKPQDLEKIDAALNLTRDLLLLAPDVARVSWNQKIDLGDPSEDQARLKNISQAAALYKADTAFMTEYFQTLIKADHYVQTELHKQWRAQGVPPTMTLTRTPAQLQNASAELLPKLLAALAALPPVLEKTGAANSVRSRALELLPNRSALSEATREMAIAPLLKRARD